MSPRQWHEFSFLYPNFVMTLDSRDCKSLPGQWIELIKQRTHAYFLMKSWLMNIRQNAFLTINNCLSSYVHISQATGKDMSKNDKNANGFATSARSSPSLRIGRNGNVSFFFGDKVHNEQCRRCLPSLTRSDSNLLLIKKICERSSDGIFHSDHCSNVARAE